MGDGKWRLFLNYSGLLECIRDQDLTKEDLQCAFFFFFRLYPNYVMAPHENGAIMVSEGIFADRKKAAAARQFVIAVIAQAEEEGRVHWREKYSYSCLDDLNKLIAAKGFAALPGPIEKCEARILARLCEKHHVPLQVICSE